VRASHAIGLAYGVAGLGNAAGPLIGGLLIETVGWRWIFWLNVPLTLVALAIGAWSITESFDETVPRRIDLTGLALITVGIGLFTLTFDRAPTWGWLSPTTVIAFGLSLAALAVFVVVENRVRWPLVDLSLLHDPRFTVLVVAGTIANIAYGVTIFLSTVYLQQVRDLDPLTAGLVFLGPSAGAALGGVLAGRLAASRPPVLVMGLTTVASAVSLAALAASRTWFFYLPALDGVRADARPGLCVHDGGDAGGRAHRARRRGRGGHADRVGHTGRCRDRVSGTALEMLQRAGMSPSGAVDAVIGVLAALLLPAGVVVLLIARASRPGA
jgi:MFS family permease